MLTLGTTAFPTKPWDGYTAPKFNLHPEVPTYWKVFFVEILASMWTIVEENEAWFLLGFSLIMATIFGAGLMKLYHSRQGVGNIPANAGNSLDANGL